MTNMEEHKQFNLNNSKKDFETTNTELGDEDWISAPSVVRTDKDLLIKDFYNFTDKESYLSKGQKVKPRILQSGTSATYNLLLTDYLCGFSDVVVSRTIKLPKPSLAGIGKLYIIKDFSGSASATTVTISPFDSETIDGDTGTSLNTDFAVKRLVTDGTNWFSI